MLQSIVMYEQGKEKKKILLDSLTLNNTDLYYSMHAIPVNAETEESMEFKEIPPFDISYLSLNNAGFSYKDAANTQKINELFF